MPHVQKQYRFVYITNKKPRTKALYNINFYGFFLKKKKTETNAQQITEIVP